MHWRAVFLSLFVVALAAGCDDGGDGGAGGEGGRTIDTVDTGPGGEGGAGGGAIADATVDDVGVVRARACADGNDNDGDGLFDLDDPGCDDAADDDETNTPVCSDEIDNDEDGLTDFPDDPGCASAVDEDEYNEPVAPQCNDGIDNDRDGLTDEQDPGCTSIADPTEGQPETPPQCFDGIDNDLDGIIDFPFEPGCSAAGDNDEQDAPTLPACVNGLDDDGDGLIDYPLDPGCAAVGDRDEQDKDVTPHCADGRDNDRDGRIDFPDDDGCESAADFSERGSCRGVYDPPRLADGVPLIIDTSRGVFENVGSCGGRGSPELAVLYRLDRDVQRLDISTLSERTTVPTTLYVRKAACLDGGAEIACATEREDVQTPGQVLSLDHPVRGDYYIFVDGVAGAGGPIELTATEIPLAECLNGLDDDEDGRIDYPTDPGCSAPSDREELTEVFGACSNDEDDDGDGLVDYPLDPGCPSAAGDSEEDICGPGVPFRQYFLGTPFVVGDTAEGATTTQGTCGGDGREVVYLYHNPFHAKLVFNTAHPETEAQTIVHVRRVCSDAAEQIACDDGTQAGTNLGRAVVNNAQVGDYYVFVDTRGANVGRFKLTVEVERLPAACADGSDNDGDGRYDADDPGCTDVTDEDETDEDLPEPPACNDRLDNDDDGVIDYPYDPGCRARGDDDETDPPNPPACSNGRDDDEDGITDFPLEPGCTDRADDDERNSARPPKCANNRDDDGDGRVDYPFDPACQSAGGFSERNPAVLGVCSNGIDDDRDGVADFPFDVGCASAGADSEVNPEQAPGCSNGLDDDGDGDIDFPWDRGCEYAADPSENNPDEAPECANGEDDDNDQRNDFPSDPDCRFAADNNERTTGPVPAVCADGIDNDRDGVIDFADPGCFDALDGDETDPETVPSCGNEIDDDEDGLVDWPADPGCLSSGDLTEDQQCRPEVDVVEIPQNGNAQGVTTADDPDLYRSRCGGRNTAEAVFVYELAQAADLRISAANAGTDHQVTIDVRGNCEEPASSLACAGDFSNPDPVVTLPGAEPGLYFIFVDGGGDNIWLAGDGPVVLPEDPEGYQANHDVEQRDFADPESFCGWRDGGRDAFDCYGQISVQYGEENSGLLDVLVGERAAVAGEFGFNIKSDFPNQNVWRIHLTPNEGQENERVTLRIEGKTGARFQNVAEVRSTTLEGRQISYFHTAFNDFDRVDSDPPIVHVVVPQDPADLGRIEYTNEDREITIVATDIRLPATFYLAPGFLPHQDVIAGILGDIELAADPDAAPSVGQIEISVTELPDE